MADAKNPIPSPQPGDSDDVELALEAAQRMYAKGDLPETLKWLRRAASAAEEAGDDMRQLQLARLAADLAAVVNSGPQIVTSAPSIPAAKPASSAPGRLPQPTPKQAPLAASGRSGSSPPGPIKAASVVPAASATPGGPPPLPGKSRPAPPSATPPAPAVLAESDSQPAPSRPADSQPPPAKKSSATSLKPKASESVAPSGSLSASAPPKPAASTAPSAAATKVEKPSTVTQAASGVADFKTLGGVRVAVRVSARDENLYIVRPLAQGQRVPAGSREARLVFE